MKLMLFIFYKSLKLNKAQPGLGPNIKKPPPSGTLETINENMGVGKAKKSKIITARNAPNGVGRRDANEGNKKDIQSQENQDGAITANRRGKF